MKWDYYYDAGQKSINIRSVKNGEVVEVIADIPLGFNTFEEILEAEKAAKAICNAHNKLADTVTAIGVLVQHSNKQE